MQHVDDMIARLVATYPDEADLVHDVVRGVLDDSRRDGVGSRRGRRTRPMSGWRDC